MSQDDDSAANLPFALPFLLILPLAWPALCWFGLSWWLAGLLTLPVSFGLTFFIVFVFVCYYEDSEILFIGVPAGTYFLVAWPALCWFGLSWWLAVLVALPVVAVFWFILFMCGDSIIGETSDPEEDDSEPEDADSKKQFQQLKRAVAKLLHPDVPGIPAEQLIVREALFKQIWAEVERIEKS